MAIIDGDDNDNLIWWTDEADAITGLGGNDGIYAAGGGDLVYGGDGNDNLHTGNDSLLASDGSVDLLYGGVGDDWLVGSVSNTGDVRLYGDDGNDRLWFLEYGAAHFHEAYGGAGDDTLTATFSGATDIIAYGGDGHDWMDLTIRGQKGDSFRFIQGPDLLFTNATTGHSAHMVGFESFTLRLGAEDDFVRGNRFTNYFDVGAGRNHVFAGGGDDIVSYVAGHHNHLFGGVGVDRLAVFFDRATTFAINPDGSVDDGRGGISNGFEAFQVTMDAMIADGSLVTLGALADRFTGAKGDDTVFGGAGNDILDGTAGNNRLSGQDGDDTLTAGLGNDALSGGVGNDSLVGGGGRDHLMGDAGNDTLTAQGHSKLEGGGGDDLLQEVVPAGFDTMLGGNGNDTLKSSGDSSLSGGAGNDVLFGGRGHETLLGGDGNDTISNEAGRDQLADRIDGGSGDDVLNLYYYPSIISGGSGADHFVFSYIQTGIAGWVVSNITDFASVEDQLQFHQIGVIQLPPGQIAPNQLATDLAVGRHAQFIQSYDAAANITHLSFDPDGKDIHQNASAVLDFIGHVTLTYADILII